MIEIKESGGRKFFNLEDGYKYHLFKSLTDLWIVSRLKTTDSDSLIKGFVIPEETRPVFTPIIGEILTKNDIHRYLEQCSQYDNYAIFKGSAGFYLAQFSKDLKSRVILFRKIPNGKVHVVFDGEGKFVGFISYEHKIFLIKDEKLHYTEL